MFQIVACLETCNASNKHKNPKLKRTGTTYEVKSREVDYLKIPFDVNLEIIPVPFLGHNILDVIIGFSHRNEIKKDEFETSEQYKKRLFEKLAEPLFGQVYTDSVLVFVIENKELELTPLQKEYDADNQTLKIEIMTERVFKHDGDFDETMQGLQIMKGSSDVSETTEQNAYGAKFTVRNVRTSDYLLAIHDNKIIKEDKGFVRNLKLDPIEAKKIKDNIAALIIVKPTAPFSSWGELYRGATYSYPNRSRFSFSYLHVNLLGIWLYNNKTGVIISKIDSQQ